MARGFTLLELLITVMVLAVLLSVAAPSFTRVSESQKMKRLANELNGFVMNARSEAVRRKTELWAHIAISGASNNSGDWSIVLTDSATNPGGTVLSSLSGEAYNNIEVSTTYVSEQINFDAINGRATSGSFIFTSSGGALKLGSFRLSGKMRICAVGGDHFGFKACS
ncbi:GspH/FimT family pseudopilin [Vibrio aestuarianus]|uniref:Type II secretion system protein H n=1 Tax=Vibrio aestuarianus TaxID=28171 RepID=A0A7X6N783_9VIBR|nr:GspH/FimT family pseudopilin [Vibrio aestuarianus]KOE83015.1 pilus assembly protein FimT [Vibrio alginolyticus]MDE1213977.1 GspH/FimT family pseudopilin [Vibrio aestuarianus]MDE1217557.1 GspH/FimT family pseudopilin [Vibrio aestuarianus]MDE1228817.1 GspH/FimT family pseudopilin [Vibrio aestuarianus]MDE1232189.1 GspH/FimT family pseudopilin [Vibrio aestuarianus]